MTTQEAARLMKLAKISQKIATHISLANVKKNMGKLMEQPTVVSINDDRIRKYCRWSHLTAYAMQLCLEGIQARAKYQSTYVTAG